MKRSISILILCLVLVAVLLGATLLYRNANRITVTATEDTKAEGAEESVELAADFSVETFNGESVSLSDYFGKPIVLNFWATWCGPCQSELPAFDQAYRSYGDRVQFMMVDLTDGSRDTKEKVLQFVEENNYSFPVFLDVELDAALAYGVYSIPTTVFISPDGTVSASYLGAMSAETLEAGIKSILSDEK